jgi:hypothetical protein
MRKAAFELQIVVDVYDDFIGCHFTERTFREMMRIFKGWGITRVYWNGQAYASGLYDAESSRNLDRNALRTYQEVGEFIPAAVKYAHEQDLELYVEFKPFDMFFPLLAPHGLSLFKVHNPARKGIPALGGAWQMGASWPEENTQFLMARDLTGIRQGVCAEPIGMIKFVKNDDRPTGITRENLRIYVSRDNRHYALYERPYGYQDVVENRPVMLKGVNLNRPGERRERVRVITLDGLEIAEPYLAIATGQKTGAPDFANRYYKLVELYTTGREPLPFTYGVPSPGADAWYPPELAALRFPERGFMFDLSEQLMANNLAFRANDEIGFLDSVARLLGLAKGKNPWITTLCPVYPEVRRYWLDQIGEFIAWGVDGVEFRWAAHQDTREWDAYGFNAPVVAECRRRQGLDILREGFERGPWRALLGEYYTGFLREAKTVLAGHGRGMLVDVMPSNNADPRAPQFANIHLDWEQWFEFADGVSLKWVDPRDRLFRDAARRRGIPVYPNIWPQVVFQGWGQDAIKAYFDLLDDNGDAGFILYEASFFMKARPDGTFEIVYPDVAEAIVPAVRALNAKVG